MCFCVWNKPNRRIVWNHSSPLSRSAVMATAYDWHKTHCSFLSFSPRGRFSVLSERWVKKSRKQGNHRLQGEAGSPEGIYANWFIGVRANCWCTLLTNCPSFIWIKRCWTITKKVPSLYIGPTALFIQQSCPLCMSLFSTAETFQGPWTFGGIHFVYMAGTGYK